MENCRRERYRIGAVVAGAVVAMALLRPPIPGDGGVLNLLGDIGRDIRSARQYLADDLRELQTIVFQPVFTTFQSITTQFGKVAGLFLLGIWGQALLVSARAAARERSAAAVLCCAALMATCVLGASACHQPSGARVRIRLRCLPSCLDSRSRTIMKVPSI